MIDLSGYDAPAPGDVEFQLVPDGTYLAHTTNAQDVQAKGGKKSWQLALHLTVKHHGQRVPVRVYIAHSSAKREPITYGRKRIFELAQACGLEFPAPAPGQGPHLDPGAIRGQMVEVTLKLVEDSGFAPKNELEASAPARKDASGNYLDPQAETAVPADAAAPTAGLPANF